jgi:hypothetical protein
MDVDGFWNPLALMETASFCSGVQSKRYSGQQETASKASTAYIQYSLYYYALTNF